MAYGAFKDKWVKWLSSKRFDKNEQRDSFRLSDSRVQEGRSPFEADIRSSVSFKRSKGYAYRHLMVRAGRA